MTARKNAGMPACMHALRDLPSRFDGQAGALRPCLKAQRSACAEFTRLRDGKILGEYVEVESGKRNERPQLARFLAKAKRAGAVLLIAKLDRLARNVAFIANLLESGVEMTAADMP